MVKSIRKGKCVDVDSAMQDGVGWRYNRERNRTGISKRRELDRVQHICGTIFNDFRR